MSSRLSGVIAAIATPIAGNGEPDAQRFMRLAAHLLADGCDGLNVLGTTGEATSFSLDQRLTLMRATAGSGLPMGRMMVGTGAAAAADAARLTAAAEELGFAGALVLPPFYYKGVPEAGIVGYFREIAAAAPKIPLYLYNFPAMTGIVYAPSLVRTLMETLPGRIAGLKDSSGNLAYAREVAAISPELAVFPSSEETLMEARTGMFAGCISATANLNSAFCAAAFRDGDEAAFARAVSVRRLFDGKALVPGVKAVLAHVHGDAALAEVRPPWTRLPPAEAAALAADFDRAAGRA